MIHEYLSVLLDPAHLLSELTFTLFFDGLVGAVLWPLVKRAVRRHDAREHGR